jgi:hypothetical protein
VATEVKREVVREGTEVQKGEGERW